MEERLRIEEERLRIVDCGLRNEEERRLRIADCGLWIEGEEIADC